MVERPLPPKEEVDIGMEIYFSDLPPIGGVLKSTAEDFIVNEISYRPKETPDGEHAIATVTVENWETNRLIKVLSRILGISKKRIGFAGTKDKRAVTSQLMSFRCPSEDVSRISLKDVKIENIYRSNRELNIGDLFGNEFNIRIRNIDMVMEETKKRAQGVMDQIIAGGGFPNYFGVQRFGAIRPITHLIGKSILKRKFEEAVMIYVANPLPNEPKESFECRSRLQKEMDFKDALTYYPKTLSFERSMIQYLSRNPDDWIGALGTLPENLSMMFVHAYQSYIFNKVLSERIRRGIPLNQPIIGDMILPLNKKNLPDHYRYIEVTGSNHDEVNELVSNGLGFVSGMLMGYEEKYASGEMGEIERSIALIDGIYPEDFNIFEMAGLSSKGVRRELLSPVFDLKWRVLDQKDNGSMVELKFSLFKGTYATSLMRDIMKAGILDY